MEFFSVNKKVVFISLFLSFFNMCFVSSLNIKNNEIQLLVGSPVNQNAIKFVGNTRLENGAAQLELLLIEGLKQDQYVLEIGCGALVASIPIMSYLDDGHFVGIEPNQWLIHDSLNIRENYELCFKKAPQFFYNSNFDGSLANIEFDYIIAHSIISHAANWQFLQFLENCAKVLKPNGKVIFSLRLTKPNKWGSPGSSEDETYFNEWMYPGNTYFKEETVFKEASKLFRKVEHIPEYTDIITKTDGGAFHDWFVLTK